ncbi:MAG: hypothetical protein K2H45_11520, partial [Acetatifactor sp.]|nr:hypothetical protein [Acetatifactor sp.]
MCKILKGLSNPEDYFPPGYEYEMERNSAGLLLGIGAVLSLSFFVNLYHAVEALYEYVNHRQILRKNAVAASFAELVGGQWMFYIPFVLFLAAMVIYHYFYYCRETKSIYLMRRLPRRGVLFKSCVKGPLLGLGIGTVALAALYL